MSKISICIPAYNRPHTLVDLLQSILSQDFADYDIVICEDYSPARSEIRSLVEYTKTENPDVAIHYFENEKNLGFDANLRRLLEVATGDFCMYAGDDDLFYPNALQLTAQAIDQYPDIGAITRAYHVVDRFTGNIISESRYFNGDRYFPPSTASAISFFRRFVFMTGLVVHRQGALALSTDIFDGTLLYQTYLASSLVLKNGGYFISTCIAQNRVGEDHYFGSSQAEKELFSPQRLTPDHSVNFMRGMLRIAQHIENINEIRFYDPVVADLAAYAYPYLVAHSANRRAFWKYARDLSQLGFGRYPYFWIYVLLLMFPGRRVTDRIREFLKNLYHRTPQIGSFYQGIPVSTTETKK